MLHARIDRKYLLGLELTDAGFDNSVLSEFRSRLLDGQAESQLLDKLLVHLQETELLKERGRQRSDSTHVFSSERDLNRLEHVAETLRAVLRLRQIGYEASHPWNGLSVMDAVLKIDYPQHVWNWHFVREKPPEEPSSDVLTIRAKEVDEKGPAGQPLAVGLAVVV